MDISDQATEREEQFRDNALRNAKASNPVLAAKRERVLRARELAGQRGADDTDVVELGVGCENCGDPLTLESDGIFCCKECVDDWDRRERARKNAGHSHF